MLSPHLWNPDRAPLGNPVTQKMAIKLSAGPAILPEDSPERESMPKLTHMAVGMIQSLPGYWIKCLTSWWFVDSSLPHGFLHRAAHNVASGFLHSEQTRE